MKIIVIGKMLAGKTTVSDHLCKTRGYRHVALADPIKEIESMLNPNSPNISNSFIYEWVIGSYLQYDAMDQAMLHKIFDEVREMPREEPKPRKRLQYLGTDGVRKRVDDKLWIKLAAARAKATESDNVVIDDVRFLNEYEYFIGEGWYPIKLEVSPEVQDRRIRALYGDYDPSILEHPSEKDQDIIFKRMDNGLYINADLPLQDMLDKIDSLLFSVPVGEKIII